ncbi:MAG TPA: hypothetical protein VJ032_03085, partial [Thermoanaerobaculia bacterium]|nr:hypothetical protein [Thermoanaerobaculia bacterium]
MNVRIVRSFALNLVLLILAIAVIVSCQPPNEKSVKDTSQTQATGSASTAGPTLVPLTTTITPCGPVTTGEACITLKVAGLAHLIDGPNPAKLRTLVVPDMTSIGHETLLL